MQSLTVLLALGFAAYRVTQLVVHDSIGDPVRQRIEMWHARKFDSPVRGFVRDLLGCTYCTGFHAAWLTVLVYTLAIGQNAPWASLGHFWTFGVSSFAVAGVQALLNRIDDTLPVRG